MKVHSLASGLFAVFMASTIAHAQTNLSQGAILDLPLFDSMDNVPDSGAKVGESSGEQVLAGSIRLSKIPRTGGGTELRLDLSEALVLQRIDLRIVSGRIKLHKFSVALANGQELDMTVREDVLSEGTLEKIQDLSAKGQVKSLRILAESYGQESDLLVTAVSSQKLPQLSVRKYEERQQTSPPQNVAQNEPGDRIGDILVSEGLVTQDPRTSCGAKFCVGETVIHVNIPGTIMGRIESESSGSYTIRVGNSTFAGTEQDLAKVSGCESNLCVDEFIYAGTNSGLQSAQVIGIGATGFVLKFINGPLNGVRGGHWALDSIYRDQGCVAELCAGEYVIISTSKTTERGRIVGISPAGRYAVEEHTGAKRGVVTAWNALSLSKVSGCSGSFCVGDEVLNIATQPITRARVIGQRLGVYALEFLSAPYQGRLGGGWEAQNLALTRGCLGPICVGHQVRLVQDTRIVVKIIGIQRDKFVIQFLNSRQKGTIQSNWPAHSFTW